MHIALNIEHIHMLYAHTHTLTHTIVRYICCELMESDIL